MAERSFHNLYSILARVILLAVCAVVALWILSKVYAAILLLLFALVLAIVINAPVTWLEGKKIKRGWASLIVFLSILLVVGLIGWLVVPKVATQLQLLISNLPVYLTQINEKIDSLMQDIPGMESRSPQKGFQVTNLLPSFSQALSRITNFSFTLLNTILLLIIFFSMVVYAVVNPKPLLEIYYSWFHPGRRSMAAKAYNDAAVMLTGWFKSNLIGGLIQAVVTTIVLSLLGVPGAWVWGALALIAEIIPKIGFYLTAVPPTLIALSVSNTTAIWVGVFFIVMDEIMGDFVMPRIRSSTMDIHPVSILFMVTAMGAAFGLMGILLAVPMAAIIKAYYYTFYVNRQDADPALEARIQQSIYRIKQ